MAENVDLTLVLERLNEVLVGQREIKDRLATVEIRLTSLNQNTATRSQFLALAETFNQFDSLLATLDSRVAMIEARHTQ